jgi:hypothetical protein
MYFLHAKIIHRRRRRCRRKTVGKMAKFLKINYFIPIISQKLKSFLGISFFIPELEHVKKSGCYDNFKCSNFLVKVS